MSIGSWRPIAAAACVSVSLILLVQMASRVADASNCTGDNCSIACKTHNRWCHHDSGQGWRTYSYPPGEPGEEEVEVAYNWCCSVFAEGGSAGEKEKQWFVYFEDCDPDCSSTETGRHTTGAPYGDWVGTPGVTTFDMVCGDT